MRLHREGFTIILITTLVLGAINVPLQIYLSESLISTIVLAISLLLYIAIVQFFRHPNRNIPTGENLIIAPADGKVVVIEEVVETEYFKDKRRQVSIFMSPINVHVNRYPVSGKVAYQKYHPGKYLVAWHPKSSTENERTTVVVESSNKTCPESIFSMQC
jgi:phosphatidylserine decarboxylase